MMLPIYVGDIVEHRPYKFVFDDCAVKCVNHGFYIVRSGNILHVKVIEVVLKHSF